MEQKRKMTILSFLTPNFLKFSILVIFWIIFFFLLFLVDLLQIL